MDAFIVSLSVVSLLAGLVLAFVIYQVIRLVIAHFRERADDEERKRFLLLRMSDRAVAIVCAVCFFALVL